MSQPKRRDPGVPFSAIVREYAEALGLPVEEIVCTGCSYGSLEQHLNGSANCEDEHCVFSGKPVPAEDKR